MKFLIAIKNISDESKNILEIGCKIAEGFSADLTICYVGKKSKALIEGDELYTFISEEDFRQLKSLKRYLTSEDIDLLKEIAEIMRKQNPMWGL